MKKLSAYRLSFTHDMWPTEECTILALNFSEALRTFKLNLLQDSDVPENILKTGNIILVSKESK